MRARLLVTIGAVMEVFSSSASAGAWNIEPSVGAAADYESNPGLRTTNEQAEEHVAAVVDVPLRYDANGVELTLRPSGRLSDNQGYDSLSSDYVHLDTAAQFTTGVSSTTLQGQLARDSSLLYIGPLENGAGVRRDLAASAFDWTRSLTERAQAQLDASWSEVRYDQPANATNLVNYHYLSAGPTWNFAATERTTFKILASAGKYQSLNGITESKSYSAQLGFVRQLAELWSLSATAGYAHSINSESYYYGPFYLGTLKSSENSTVYSATLTRRSERFNLTAGASRAFTPTGFAYLSKLDSINVTADYTQSERWDYALSAAWQKANNPAISGQATTLHYINAQVNVNWHWTPQWMLTLNVGRISQEYGSPTVSSASNAAVVTVTRRFLRTEL